MFTLFSAGSAIQRLYINCRACVESSECDSSRVAPYTVPRPQGALSRHFDLREKSPWLKREFTKIFVDFSPLRSSI
jgi:hypothetical protein